jgi:hypothetical protein
VIWDFAGEPIDASLLDDVAAIDVAFLKRWLSRREIDAVRARIDEIGEAATFPDPPLDRRPYPWPPV